MEARVVGAASMNLTSADVVWVVEYVDDSLACH